MFVDENSNNLSMVHVFSILSLSLYVTRTIYPAIGGPIRVSRWWSVWRWWIVSSTLTSLQIIDSIVSASPSSIHGHSKHPVDTFASEKNNWVNWNLYYPYRVIRSIKKLNYLCNWTNKYKILGFSSVPTLLDEAFLFWMTRLH